MNFVCTKDELDDVVKNVEQDRTRDWAGRLPKDQHRKLLVKGNKYIDERGDFTFEAVIKGVFIAIVGLLLNALGDFLGDALFGKE